MPEMKYVTRGGGIPQGKRRVYFTCHPADFEKYFDKLCQDIFKTHDVAIYYTEDLSAPFAPQELETDLGSSNLLVVPVTFRLMHEPNRAMQGDIAYAKQAGIPILPFLMEAGIESIYALPKNFGERQYLSPYADDLTAVSYQEKLKKHLEAVLISDETVKRVRAAFDAYIFLSYRKKDRRHAKQLMQRIHSDPRYRDIAIWYDEFLTPGESFRDNIRKALDKSSLFALLVTPNLLEEPNFILSEEYPLARAAGKPILPVEMVITEKALLQAKYQGIPNCVDPRDEDALRARLAACLSGLVRTENDRDPAHSFLMGLAYLEGIDVETDRAKGIALITAAAEAELPEAMQKLYAMHSESADYQAALVWAEKLVKYHTQRYGEEDHRTLFFLNDLSSMHDKLGQYQKALELQDKIYTLSCKVLGTEHRDTLTSLGNLAYSYGKSGQHRKALALQEKAYTLRCRVLGEQHPKTLASLNNLAWDYSELEQHHTAQELGEKAYALYCRVLGREHPGTLTCLCNLATTYGKLGQQQKALALQEKAYTLRCRVLGEQHPDTLTSLSNLASAYKGLGQHEKALALEEDAYVLRCRVLGEAHPDTLTSLSNLASTYGELGQQQKALALQEKAYALRCRVLGQMHPDTLSALGNLAVGFIRLGDHQKALALQEKAYTLRCRSLGREHPDTLLSLSNLAYTYGELGQQQKALALQEKVYALRHRLLGENHADTMVSLGNLAYAYSQLGQYRKALALDERAYALRCRMLGAEHPDTLTALNNLAYTYYRLGEHRKSLEAFEKVLTGFRSTHPDRLPVIEQNITHLRRLLAEECAPKA